jgi:hypothetical protein
MTWKLVLVKIGPGPGGIMPHFGGHTVHILLCRAFAFPLLCHDHTDLLIYYRIFCWRVESWLVINCSWSFFLAINNLRLSRPSSWCHWNCAALTIRGRISLRISCRVSCCVGHDRCIFSCHRSSYGWNHLERCLGYSGRLLCCHPPTMYHRTAFLSNV